MHLSEEQRS